MEKKGIVPFPQPRNTNDNRKLPNYGVDRHEIKKIPFRPNSSPTVSVKI